MNLKPAVAAIGLVLLVLLAGCIQQSEQSQKKPLVITHQTWVGDAPIYLAKEKGFLEKNGVNVEFLRVERDADRRALLASGKVDIAFETIDMSVLDVGAGVPEVMVLKLDESLGADGVIAAQGIQSIADLRGKKVGCSVGGPPYFLLRILMEKNGVEKESVQFLDIAADEAGAAFVSGDIDAACTWEPWLSKAKERAGGHVLVSSADVPGTIVDVMVVRPEVLKNRREEVKAVAKSWLEAYDYIQTNPKESYGIMAKSFDLSSEEFEEFIQGLKWNDLQENKEFFKSPIFEVTNEINRVAVQDGMIPQSVDVQEIIDPTIIQEIQ